MAPRIHALPNCGPGKVSDLVVLILRQLAGCMASLGTVGACVPPVQITVAKMAMAKRRRAPGRGCTGGCATEVAAVLARLNEDKLPL